MEAILILGAVVLGGVVLVLPIVALVLCLGSRDQQRTLEQRIEVLTYEVQVLRRALEARPREEIRVSPEVQGSASTTGAEAAAGALSPAGDGGVVLPDGTPGAPLPREPGAQASVDLARSVEGGAIEGPVPSVVPAQPAPPAEPTPEVVPALHATALEGPPAPTTRPPEASPEAPQSIEERIGLVWFTRLGALLGIMAAGWFFKYMVDNNWVGPWGRVTLGVVAGLALLGWGELMARARRSHAIFVQGILGLGLALLMITCFAAVSLYHLVPTLTAFGLVALLAVLGGALSAFHNSQGILILTLIAVFLNPVLLSTGVDRPLALFTYLLLMTSGALWVAVRRDMRLAAWLGVAGTGLLFCGWYLRFFDAAPPPEPGLVDRPPDELMGAYFPLDRRLVPLLFAVLFPVQWVLLGWHHRKDRRITALALFMSAAVGSHAAMASLLYDKPLLLGGSLIVLGGGFALLLTRLGLGSWLGLPMATSFAVLAGLSRTVEHAHLWPMMLICGGLAGLYFAVFFRQALTSGTLARPRSLLLSGAAGLGLLLLSMLLLLPRHGTLFSLITTSLALGYLLIWVHAGSMGLLVSVFLLGLGSLGLGTERTSDLEPALLGIQTAWFLLHLGILFHDMVRRRSPWTRGRLAVLTGLGLGFGALFLTGTEGTDSLIRALFCAGSGAAYLFFGVRMMRLGQGDPDEDGSLFPLGMALCFFTLAWAFLLSGPSITVVWAVEGAVLAGLAVRFSRRGQTGHPAWLWGSLAMTAIALLRLFIVDFFWIEQQEIIYYNTLGRQGMLLPHAFLNPRAISLLTVGAVLLVSARFFQRCRQQRLFAVTALVSLVVGHAALLTLCISEVRILFTVLPPVPDGSLPREEFFAMTDKVQASLDAQATKLQMTSTVVMGSYAILLLGIGFLRRHLPHRLLGIAVFALALLKLGLLDIWSLHTLHRVIVGGSIAALLLCGGFLYSRFGSRLRDHLLSDGSRGLLLLVIVGGSLLFATPARALDPELFQSLSHVQGPLVPGDYRFIVTPELYSASLGEPPLSDLRIMAHDLTEVPYLRRPLFQARTEETLPTRLLDPVMLPDGSSSATLDLGSTPPVHNRLSLTFEGRNFLRRGTLYASEDGTLFGVLSDGFHLFDISTGGPRAVRTSLTYPASRARYLRIRLLPEGGQRAVRITAALVSRLDQPLPGIDPYGSVGLSVVGPDERDEKDKRFTRFNLSILPTHLPVERLRLKAGQGEFVRQVRVLASTRRHAWFEIGQGVVYRVRQHPDSEAMLEDLEVPARVDGRPWLRLLIEDGDNPAFPLQEVQARYPLEEVLFRTSKRGEHQVLIGRKGTSAPRYDLPELVRRGGTRNLRSATISAPEPNPRHGLDQPPPEDRRPFSERHRLPLQIFIGAVVLLLGGWTVWLLRRQKP